MNTIQKQIYLQMIEADLQQAWELLENDNFKLAIHHFEQAIAKTKEMESASSPSPGGEGRGEDEQPKKQITLNV